MFVAEAHDLHRVYSGSEIQTQINNGHGKASKWQLVCPICGGNVVYNSSSINRPFEYFTHSDGSTDCFSGKSISDGHRIAVEVAVKTIYNRIHEVTGEPVTINVEKWIGSQHDFVIADIRVTEPLKIAVEVFHKSTRLGIYRRFQTMFDNEYRVYLVFHTRGQHNADQVEHHIQRIAPLRVGRFHPHTMELSLGDLFTKEEFEVTPSTRERLPMYMVI